jgi:hypothetical protein
MTLFTVATDGELLTLSSAHRALIANVTSFLTGRSKQSKGLRVG